MLFLKRTSFLFGINLLRSNNVNILILMKIENISVCVSPFGVGRRENRSTAHGPS